jgi:NTE family protein
MSYSLPLLFKPVVYNNYYYVDGGIVNNYPIKYFKNDIKNTIGITLINQPDEITNLFSFIKNVINSSCKTEKFKQYALDNSIYIYPINNSNILDFEQINIHKNDMVQTGYQAAKTFHQNKINITKQFVQNILFQIINNITND